MPVDYQTILGNMDRNKRERDQLSQQVAQNPYMSGQVNPGLMEMGQQAFGRLQSRASQAMPGITGGLAKGARLAGGIAAKTLLPITALGAVGNFAGRVLGGQDLGRAAMATVGDTANFMAMGIAGENAGDRLANAVGFKGNADDQLKSAMREYQEASANGSVLGAAKAAQDAQRLYRQETGGMPGADGDPMLAMQLQSQQAMDQQFADASRMQEFGRLQQGLNFNQTEAQRRQQVRFNSGNQALGEFMRSRDRVNENLLAAGASYRY